MYPIDLVPRQSCGFVKIAGLTINTDAARKLAADIIKEADCADESMAQLRSGLLHKLN
jgi:hypothetical protein